MRRLAGVWFLVASALALPVSHADAQISFGLHASRAGDVFGGADGLGVNVETSLPMVPVRFLLAGDYFFPDCGEVEGCAFAGGSADLHLVLPFPFVQPYGAFGLVYRRHRPSDAVEPRTHAGFGGGIGLELPTPLATLFGEARWEVADPDDQLLLRVGLRF